MTVLPDPEERGPHEEFETVQRGLTVEMIATKRCDLETCRRNELVSDVIERMSNTERYDYLPVTDVGSDGKERIAGLYAVGACTAGEDVSAERVDRRFCPLSEDLLIGAKVSILDYIGDSGKKPVRLVVSDSGIVGLVTRSDLQKPPARVALFALLTGFEVIMSDVIRTRLPCDGWMQCLSCGRRQILEEQINKSRSLEE